MPSHPLKSNTPNNVAEIKRLELLDYGRWAAALAVLAYHYLFNGISNGKISTLKHIPEIADYAKYGYLGVQFFFLISGFVIFQSAHRRSAGSFLSSRAARLYPGFWIAVSCTSLAAQLWGQDTMAVTLKQYFANLTMFYNELGQPPVDGAYWTLVYEWRFYLLVFAMLALGLETRLPTLIGVWSVYLLCAHAVGLSSLPYAHSNYAWFVSGAFFAMLMKKKHPGIIIGMACSLFVCFESALTGSAKFALQKGILLDPHVIVAILVGELLFFAFLITPRGGAMRLPGSRLVGGLTYPLYLVHAHIGYMLLSRFATDENKGLIYPLVLGAVILIATTIHFGIERHFARQWRQLFSGTVGFAGDTLAQYINTFKHNRTKTKP